MIILSANITIELITIRRWEISKYVKGSNTLCLAQNNKERIASFFHSKNLAE